MLRLCRSLTSRALMYINSISCGNFQYHPQYHPHYRAWEPLRKINCLWMENDGELDEYEPLDWRSFADEIVNSNTFSLLSRPSVAVLSTLLRTTTLSYGNMRFSGTCPAETPQSIKMKFCKIDYVDEVTRCAKNGYNRLIGGGPTDR
jgi:hypothetical protein